MPVISGHRKCSEKNISEKEQVKPLTLAILITYISLFFTVHRNVWTAFVETKQATKRTGNFSPPTPWFAQYSILKWSTTYTNQWQSYLILQNILSYWTELSRLYVSFAV